MRFYEFPTEIINDNVRLKLPPITDDELPYVSLVTITYNRPEFIDLMLRNYLAIDYPREKLEWIIVDDTIKSRPDYSKLQKVGAKIYCVDRRLNIGHKRNFINCLTKYDYIVHMDDDDFYPSCSVVARIRVLLEYEKHINSPGSVACTVANCYDLITDKTFEAYDSVKTTVSESTFAYSKKFWKQRPFDNSDAITECISFIGDREVCIIPSSFVITQFTHNTNTVTRRPVKKTLQTYNFMNTLSMSDYNLVNNIKTKLILKMPEYKEPLAFVTKVIQPTKSNRKPKDIQHMINDLFEEQPVSILKNPLVIKTRYEHVQTKTRTTGKDIVYYCGPSDYF